MAGKSLSGRDDSPVSLRLAPQFDSLRSDPRFHSLLRRMKLRLNLFDLSVAGRFLRQQGSGLEELRAPAKLALEQVEVEQRLQENAAH